MQKSRKCVYLHRQKIAETCKYALSSLDKFRKKYVDMLGTPYILHTSDLNTEAGVTYLPIYMTPLL